jgi:uncharacterized DUF497 family protein
MPIRFEWDPEKGAQNLAKHGVSFPEAEGVFADPLALELPDPDHSEHEERWLLVGQSYRSRLLVVVFTERGDAVRLISARRASSAETKSYEEQDEAT